MPVVRDPGRCAGRPGRTAEREVALPCRRAVAVRLSAGLSNPDYEQAELHTALDRTDTMA